MKTLRNKVCSIWSIFGRINGKKMNKKIFSLLCKSSIFRLILFYRNFLSIEMKLCFVHYPTLDIIWISTFVTENVFYFPFDFRMKHRKDSSMITVSADNNGIYFLLNLNSILIQSSIPTFQFFVLKQKYLKKIHSTQSIVNVLAFKHITHHLFRKQYLR